MSCDMLHYNQILSVRMEKFDDYFMVWIKDDTKYYHPVVERNVFSFGDDPITEIEARELAEQCFYKKHTIIDRIQRKYQIKNK